MAQYLLYKSDFATGLIPGIFSGERDRMIHQTTINEAISFSGIGLHSGCGVEMSIHPAPPDTGIVFRRTDLDGYPVEAAAAYVANVSYATSLMKHGVIISTVEHVLSALYGMGVDNAFIDLDNLEVPILDGSARPFVIGIEEAGIRTLDATRKVLRVRRCLHHGAGEKSIAVSPGDALYVSYAIEFDHPLIGRQEMNWEIAPEAYAAELAPCRTFGFLQDITALKENGLIKGGSLENAVVLSGDGLLNPEGLRFPDEFVRHKIMDFLGDISLLGRPVLGNFHAVRAGHGLHAAIVRKILADPGNYTIEAMSPEAAVEVA